MKRNLLIALLLACSASFAAAQVTTVSNDVLGAHLNYGRGCAGCHAPHSGAYGNGAAKTADPTSGDVYLWGEDVASLYTKTIVSGGGGYTEVFPSSMTPQTSDVSGMLTCLSCHDGNYAQGAMMNNAIYESVAGIKGYGTGTIPTLLGNDGTTVGNYLNDHPVGNQAVIGCGGQYNWDCTINASGAITVPSGVNFAAFVTDYGFFVKPGTYNNQPIVVCTTCHNQHLMNVVKVTTGTKTGLTSGNYATMFFVLAPYNPASTTAGSNQTAQFCRQCHGGEANESNGSSAKTIF